MPAWMDVLERERANLRTALDHAGGSGSVTLGLRIAAALWPFWDVRGRYREGAARLEVLLAADSDRTLPAYGRALSAHGWLVALMGDFVRADELMRRGLAHRAGARHARAAGVVAGRARQRAVQPGRRRGSRGARSRRAWSWLARRPSTFLIGFCLFGLAYVALLEGDIEGMKENLQESLDLTRLMIQPWGIAWAQFSVGVVAILEGDTAAAVAPLVESLQLRWSIRDAGAWRESIQLLATLASTPGRRRVVGRPARVGRGPARGERADDPAVPAPPPRRERRAPAACGPGRSGPRGDLAARPHDAPGEGGARSPRASRT